MNIRLIAHGAVDSFHDSTSGIQPPNVITKRTHAREEEKARHSDNIWKILKKTTTYELNTEECK